MPILHTALLPIALTVVHLRVHVCMCTLCMRLMYLPDSEKRVLSDAYILKMRSPAKKTLPNSGDEALSF